MERSESWINNRLFRWPDTRLISSKFWMQTHISWSPRLMKNWETIGFWSSPVISFHLSMSTLWLSAYLFYFIGNMNRYEIDASNRLNIFLFWFHFIFSCFGSPIVHTHIWFHFMLLLLMWFSLIQMILSLFLFLFFYWFVIIKLRSLKSEDKSTLIWRCLYFPCLNYIIKFHCIKRIIFCFTAQIKD